MLAIRRPNKICHSTSEDIDEDGDESKLLVPVMPPPPQKSLFGASKNASPSTLTA